MRLLWLLMSLLIITKTARLANFGICANFNNMLGLRTWIEIDKKAIAENYKTFRKLAGVNCSLMAVVKSNAYGHGLIVFSKAAEKQGVDWFGADSIVEALALRKNGIKKPILVLGHTLPERINEAALANIGLTISNHIALRALGKLKNNFPKIHLKIDTGMHRQGFYVENLPDVISFLKSKLPQVKIEGIYTHFAAAKNPAFPSNTSHQIEEFKKAASIVESAGFKPIKHAAATSGAVAFPESHFDMVRIGIGLYGLWPSTEAKLAFSDKIKLAPVLSWRTIIGEIKEVKKGGRVGYDFTEKLNRNSRIAILPVGYWHGYPRALSSVGRVLIGGKRAKVLGRVSMDMTAVDVTDINNAKVGDVVTLIGRDGKDRITAEELAELSGTINYELITRINPLIERVYK